ncbi:hypothetical protein D1115_14125 [Vibrio alfacsensis]|uniref:Glycosyltransferase subfamily 4-like N-terminal domain-containing protein n=1 Tax=Vibrio alfacsensis TaxID=1074311 RepID=A0ABN5PH14_9VIBR|nr:hypothetical protein D1115_14125 [Vibrio alfacsensis]
MPLVLYPRKSSELFSSAICANYYLVKAINGSDFDIVHLHWVNAGLLSVEDIQKIEKPIVWTLHDSWAFTGGCHLIADGCKLYQEPEGCNNCPKIGTAYISGVDISSRNFKRKKSVYSNKMIFI